MEINETIKTTDGRVIRVLPGQYNFVVTPGKMALYHKLLAHNDICDKNRVPFGTGRIVKGDHVYIDGNMYTIDTPFEKYRLTAIVNEDLDVVGLELN